MDRAACRLKPIFSAAYIGGEKDTTVLYGSKEKLGIFCIKGKCSLDPFYSYKVLSRPVKMEKERRNLMMETEGEQDEKNTAGN